MIIRLFEEKQLTGWRYTVAGWLRKWAGMLDHGHDIVIGTEDMRLLQECAESCIEAVADDMTQRQMMAAARADGGAAYLQMWRPDGRAN